MIAIKARAAKAILAGASDLFLLKTWILWRIRARKKSTSKSVTTARMTCSLRARA